MGVNRGYTVTTGVWARGILQHEYGVDLSRITWVLSGDEHVAEYQPPSNVVPIDKGKKLEDMLRVGEIACGHRCQVDAAGREAAHSQRAGGGLCCISASAASTRSTTRWWSRTSFSTRTPHWRPDIFNAFAQAKRLYLERLKGGQIEAPTPSDKLFRRIMDMTGRPAAVRHRAQSRRAGGGDSAQPWNRGSSRAHSPSRSCLRRPPTA